MWTRRFTDICPRFFRETSGGSRCLVTGYFRASDPPGVLTSIYKDPAASEQQAGRQQGLKGRKTERQGEAGPCCSDSSLIAKLPGRILLVFLLTVHLFVFYFLGFSFLSECELD